MKKYAITIQNQGAVVVSAKTKKEAIAKFISKGYQVTAKDVYLY